MASKSAVAPRRRTTGASAAADLEPPKKKPCLLEEFSTLSSIEAVSRSAKIEGVLISISPMKPGKMRDYFEGQLADETGTIRVVGFDNVQQKQLSIRHDEKVPFILKDCQITKSRFGDKLEVLLKKSTAFLTSSKKITTVLPTSSKQALLSDLTSIEDYQHVSVAVKVMKLHEQTEVKPGLYKQDIVISDATGSARLTVWQDQINILEQDKSYKLDNLTVRSYNGSKYLTLPKSEFVIKNVDDIGEVKEEQVVMDYEENEIIDAEVTAVADFVQGRVCISCQCKVEPINERIGRCTQCSITQRLDKCSKSTSANIIVQYNGRVRTFNAFLPMIQAITENDTIDEDTDPDKVVESLLMASVFNFTFTYNNTITSVYRTDA